MSKNYVEIKGIGYPNKGADLLLNSVLEKTKEMNFHVCMEPYSPYENKVNYPIWTKTSIYKFGINLLFPLNLLPSYITSRLGFVKPKKVNLILDASGFAYGDDWPSSLAKSRLLYEKTTARIVLLPQSLGPFTKKSSIKVAKKIARKAHYIFSREEVGKVNFEKITGKTIKTCPDITFDYNPILNKTERTKKTGVLIIPNFQVKKREGSKYITNMVKTITYILKTSKNVKLLNHEGLKDQIICEKIQEIIFNQMNVKLDILNPENGVKAKLLISTADLVITSRYHGLISALIQQVPVGCYGWSFKYDAILSRFNLPIFNLSDNDENDLKELCSKDYALRFKSEEYRKELLAIKQEIKQMWDDVFK